MYIIIVIHFVWGGSSNRIYKFVSLTPQHQFLKYTTAEMNPDSTSELSPSTITSSDIPADAMTDDNLPDSTTSALPDSTTSAGTDWEFSEDQTIEDIPMERRLEFLQFLARRIAPVERGCYTDIACLSEKYFNGMSQAEQTAYLIDYGMILTVDHPHVQEEMLQPREREIFVQQPRPYEMNAEASQPDQPSEQDLLNLQPSEDDEAFDAAIHECIST